MKSSTVRLNEFGPSNTFSLSATDGLDRMKIVSGTNVDLHMCRTFELNLNLNLNFVDNAI